ncbi:MAG: dihydrolipoyl dehydrogenase [Lachnospiraceae bacterium]
MGERFDVIVIGAGPGGYVAAIKCAKAGLRTAIVENRRVGGTCLNRGCIPAKAMIHASSLYREMQGAEKFGVSAEGIAFDYEKIVSYKEETTEKLCQGIEQLLKGNGVTILCGKGSLEQEHKVKVTGEESEEYYDAEHVILAAGSKPVILPIPGLELPGVLTSDELFRLKEMPESLVIIGGGVISVEFASVYANLGCKVTIVEAMPRLIPNMDKEISQNLKMILKKRGVDIHTSASVQRVEQEGELYTCVFTEKEQEVRVSAKYVLCAIGRCPNTEGLFGEGVSPEMERGRIVVDENFQSSLPNVYAIGDLVKGMQLAHLASAQGMYVAEILAKEAPSVDLAIVPGCVYTDPEIASAGITEDEAKEKGLEIKTGKFIMSANGKSLITKEERGFIKIVAEKETDVILGAQMMCARATDMIGELVTAMTNRMTVQQLLRGMRAHPTYNEGVQEALEEILGGAVHVMPKKKPAK